MRPEAQVLLMLYSMVRKQVEPLTDEDAAFDVASPSTDKMIGLLGELVMNDENQMLLTGGRGMVVPHSPMYDMRGLGLARAQLPPTKDIKELARRFGEEIHQAMMSMVPPGVRAYEVSAAAEKLRDALVEAKKGATTQAGDDKAGADEAAGSSEEAGKTEQK